MSGRAVVISTMTCWRLRLEIDLQLVGRRQLHRRRRSGRRSGRCAPRRRAALPECRSGRRFQRPRRWQRGRGRPAGRRRASGDGRRAVKRLEAAGGQPGAGQGQPQRRESAPQGRPCPLGDDIHDPLGDNNDLFGALPSSALFTASSVNTAASISAFSASRGTVTSARFLPLIWTGRVMVSSTSRCRLHLRPGLHRRPASCGRAPPSIPRPDAASSGANSWTRMSPASRIAQAKSGVERRRRGRRRRSPDRARWRIRRYARRSG